MAVQRISGFQYDCDNCGLRHVQENADQRYHNGVPGGWLRINIHPGRGSDTETIICESCVSTLYKELPYLKPA